MSQMKEVAFSLAYIERKTVEIRNENPDLDDDVRHDLHSIWDEVHQLREKLGLSVLDGEIVEEIEAGAWDVKELS